MSDQDKGEAEDLRQVAHRILDGVLQDVDTVAIGGDWEIKAVALRRARVGIEAVQTLLLEEVDGE